jgi:ubiquinone/menaquinone biosynthesis C-methylase UbiE
MKAIYNQIGDHYSVHRKADQRIVDTIFRLLGLAANDKLADIGAGTGNYSNAIADKGHLVYAIEPSKKMIAQARYHHNVKWVIGTAEHIPIKRNAVDGVFVTLAMHHFQSIESASLEFDRICK